MPARRRSVVRHTSATSGSFAHRGQQLGPVDIAAVMESTMRMASKRSGTGRGS